MIANQKGGRSSDEAITIYKSLGLAVQDLVITFSKHLNFVHLKLSILKICTKWSGIQIFYVKLIKNARTPDKMILYRLWLEYQKTLGNLLQVK